MAGSWLVRGGVDLVSFQVMIVNCSRCGTSFNKPPSHVRRVSAVFCSKACHDQTQTVYPPKLCEICHETFKVPGTRGSLRRYTTCPKSECRRAKKRGKNNPNWRGGVTPHRKRDMSTLEYKAWRKAVYKRDNYTCQMCHRRGGGIYLNADHIKPWAYFPDLRYDVANGRTLCLECHKKTYKDVFKWRATLQSISTGP